MSRGRRKKNSTPLSGSCRTSSRLSPRCRYPASRSMAAAGSDSEPLFGTATRSMGTDPFPGRSATSGRPGHRAGLQMSVYVLEREALGDHQDLDVVQELGNLLGGAVHALVLRGHPG